MRQRVWRRHGTARSSTTSISNVMRGRVVVLTGASSGVGRAAARAFGARGATIALVARNRDALVAAEDEIRRAGGQALVIQTDVADPEAVEHAAAMVEDRFGRIDVWCNVAMATVFARVMDTTPHEYHRVTEVTYLGYVYGTQAALRRMIPRNSGVIVQVGSALAYRSIPLQSAYCAGKAAIRGFTDSLRSELIHDGIGVKISNVHLPAVNTPQALRHRNKMPRQQQPVLPMFTPESIAEAIVWAAEHAPREMLVGWPTVKAVWAQLGLRLLGLAGVLDRYLAQAGWDGQFTGTPNEQSADILFETLPGDPGSHGPLVEREVPTDWQMRARMHPRTSLAVAAAAALGVVELVRRIQR